MNIQRSFVLVVMLALTGACSDAPPPSPNDDVGVGVDTTGASDTSPPSTPCREDQCSIAAACYDNGTANPDNPCESCSVIAAQESWTANDSATCDDGDGCTADDSCSAGVCSGSARVCTDDNPCTDDACDTASGDCAFTANSAPCDDGDPCTIGSLCVDSACQSGLQPADCDDDNPCTTDTCDSATGCVATPIDEGACDDGDTCTQDTICSAGECTGGTKKDCSDDNACTADGCKENGECTHTSIANSCVDDNLCTDDGCDPTKGCTYVPNQAACNDDNACTKADTCSGGLCGGDAIDTDDNNPCTTDSCDPVLGVTHTNNTLPCDDGDACTIGDNCQSGSCIAGTDTLTCQDDNVCTNDSCDGVKGCVFSPNTNVCDDGTDCTEDDKCKQGTCVGKLISCDDANPCTLDTCKGDGGCQHTLQLSTTCRPNFTISSPARAATVKGATNNMNVTVTGSVNSDAGAITLFTINGVNVAVAPNGTFSHTVPVQVGLNILMMEATDAMGSSNQRVQSFLWSSNYRKPQNAATKSGIVTEAIGLWIDQDTIDDGKRNYSAPKNLATIVEMALGAFDVADSIPSPAASFSLGDLFIENLTHDAPEAVLTAMSGKVRLNVTIDNIKADYEGDIWGPNPTGEVTIKTIGLKADIIMGQSGNKLTVSVSNIEVSVQEDDIDLDTDGLFGWLIDGIAGFFKGTMVDELKKSFKDAAEDNIAPLLEDALASLKLEFSFDVPAIDGGPAIGLDVVSDFDDVTTTSAGVEFILRAAGYTSKKVTPYATKTHRGVPSRINCGVGSQNLTIPGQQDLEISVSDDMVNSLLYSVWRGGLLEFTVPDSMLEDVDLSAFGVTDVVLDVSGMLAPTVSDCNPNNKLRLQVGDLQVDASLKLAGLPLNVKAWASFEVDVGIGIVSGCLTKQPGTGCAQAPLCEEVVCGIDSYCCNTQWDNSCAQCAKGGLGFGGLNCAPAKSACGPKVALNFGDIETLETEIKVTDENLLPAEGAIQELVEMNLVPALTMKIAASDLISIPLPSIDIGGAVPGIPEGTEIGLLPTKEQHLNGNTIVQGTVQ